MPDAKKPRFKSPLPKLTEFFRKSRDNWKSKYKEAKCKIKRQSDQLRYYKNRTAELKRRIKQLEKERSESEKNKSDLENRVITEKFSEVPAFHTYSIGHIFLFVALVLCASISMRAASRVLNLFSSFLGLEISVPTWTCGRLWLLRIGLYKLQRPKEIADDWIWIADHTIQLGNLKFLVVLGIRQAHLPEGELHLTHQDVEPIALIPAEKSNGETVFRQLEECIAKTGVPRQIVSDWGPDLKRGIEMLCIKYGICHTYDIKHKGAAILKRELKDDSDWQQFIAKASRSGKKVQQTKLSYMASPNQRSKARYMNVRELVDWSEDLVCHLEIEKKETGEKFKDSEMNVKFGWIYDYQDKLKDWKSLIEITQTANEYVNFMGLFKGIDVYLEEHLSEIPLSAKYECIREELIEFARGQQEKIGEKDRLLGSSEIIESVIGKYKGLQNDQVKGGFTGMILGLAAAVSDFSMDTVRSAFASTPTQKVWDWVKKKVGKSVYSQRKEFRGISKLQEQNPAEILGSVWG